MSTIRERVNQYRTGLIKRNELQCFIDIENMGSDTRFHTMEELLNDTLVTREAPKTKLVKVGRYWRRVNC